jgi:hypothetical protein
MMTSQGFDGGQYNDMWSKGSHGLYENVTNLNTQFLLCLEAYFNKTGKSARLTNYCGEPFLLSALHLKRSVWEHLGAWLVQTYLPGHEVGSSTKKKKYSHSHNTSCTDLW